MVSSVYKKLGFTLIEVLVILALFGIVLGITSIFSVSLYRSEGFFTQQKAIVTALQSARANAMLGVGGVAHGVRFETDGFFTFVGMSYETSDVDVRTYSPYIYPVYFASSSVNEVVFSAGSGDSQTAHITMHDRTRPSMVHHIVINHEGYIGN